MFEHNYAHGGAAINVDYYLAQLNNVTISNNKESAIQVSYTYSYMCITKVCACIITVEVLMPIIYVANIYANYSTYLYIVIAI